MVRGSVELPTFRARRLDGGRRIRSYARRLASPTCNPRDGTGTLGLFPELRTRLSKTQPRTSGRERASGTARSYVISIR